MARVEFRKILRIRSIFSLWQASRRPHFCESPSRRPPTSKHSYYRDANRRTTLPSNPPSFRALRPLRSISLLVRDAEGCDGWDVTRDHQNRILGRWRIGHGHGHGGRRVAAVYSARQAVLEIGVVPGHAAFGRLARTEIEIAHEAPDHGDARAAARKERRSAR